MSEFTIERANRFIEDNLGNVNPQYRPSAHFTAPVGWINDPNGFVFFKGEYHLFYQYYPYDAVWGPMHWGHAKSKDLINWEHLPVALAPDQPYDANGCFSGSAIVKDDTLWLMYTGNIVNEKGESRQVQNMAFSKDGIHFEKIAQNPVLDETDLPCDINPADFRDPKIIEKDGEYYAVIAARHQDNVGCILLTHSENLVEWEFSSIFLKGTANQGEMWECPDYFNLDGIDTILLSPMRFPKEDLSHHNINTTVVIRGEVDWRAKRFNAVSFEELDHGHDFYAPQSLEDNQGRRIMIGWLNTWGRPNITKELGHNWAFSMSIPRELHWQADKLIQVPVTEFSVNNKLTTALNVNILGLLTSDFIIHYGSESDYIIIRYNRDENAVYLDRQHLNIQLIGEESIPVIERGLRIKEPELFSFKMIVDTNSIEVFINGGSGTISSNIYFDTTTEPEFTVTAGNVNLVINEI